MVRRNSYKQLHTSALMIFRYPVVWQPWPPMQAEPLAALLVPVFRGLLTAARAASKLRNLIQFRL